MKLIFGKLFASHSSREITRLMPMVKKINAMEKEIEALSDGELRKKTDFFRAQVREKLEKIRPDLEEYRTRINEAGFDQEKDKYRLKLKRLKNNKSVALSMFPAPA